MAEGIARASGEPLLEMSDLSEFLIAVGVATPEPRLWTRGAYPAGLRPGLAILGRKSWPMPGSASLIPLSNTSLRRDFRATVLRLSSPYSSVLSCR